MIKRLYKFYQRAIGDIAGEGDGKKNYYSVLFEREVGYLIESGYFTIGPKVFLKAGKLLCADKFRKKDGFSTVHDEEIIITELKLTYPKAWNRSSLLLCPF